MQINIKTREKSKLYSPSLFKRTFNPISATVCPLVARTNSIVSDVPQESLGRYWVKREREREKVRETTKENNSPSKR